MYTCQIHNWQSVSSPCPACVRTIPSTTTNDFIINPTPEVGEERSWINLVHCLLDEMETLQPDEFKNIHPGMKQFYDWAGKYLKQPTPEVGNLKLHKQITFDELVKHGLDNGANVINGMPWSWKINGKAISHENDYCYIVETINGSEHFYKGQYLIAFKNGLKILIDYGDSHAPQGCPM